MEPESPELEKWFAPKRYGYGAGLPFTWQGWVVIVVYTLVVIALGWWAKHNVDQAWIAAGGIVLATAAFLPIVYRHTRGGWHWRWGERE